MSNPTKKMTIQDLLTQKLKDHDIERVLGKLNAGAFGDCHTQIHKETGVWIPELVPVFERLDAMLVFRDAPVQ
jgi:hypothetical protein